MTVPRRIAGILLITLVATVVGATRGAADEDAPPASSAADTALVTQADLARVLEGYTEQIQAMTADLDKLKKFKWSGYVQARWETGEASSDSVKVAGSPYTVTSPNLNRFYLRRARLKLAYDTGALSQAVVYVDAGADRAVKLLEAYVTLLDPWTPLHDHQLTIGQFNVPFGFEIERSSSTRELPERSRAENVLFSGERDRGVKLVSQWTERLQTSAALLNGGGVNSTDFPATDPTRGKDFVARARWSQGTFDVAGSYYFGRHLVPLTGADVQTEKSRVGLDAQAYFTLPVVGGGTLRGEWYAAHEANPDSAKALIVAPTSANPVRLLKPGADPDHLATDAAGGYLMWVQNAGDRVQGVVRWDRWDPNVDADHDQYSRWSVGANWFWDGFTRISLAYDAIRTETKSGARWTDPHDNLWTLQVQHKF
ncbi:MAG: porin [Candidatus Eisenbacteria bacterium]